MQKKTVISVIVVAMILVIALYFISGTYARYVSEFSGDATLSIAKWVVALKNGDTPIDTLGNMTFTVQNNDDVANGKIAPSGKATADVTIDLTGTEVSVDLTAKLDETKVKEKLGTLGINTESIKVTTEVTGVTSTGSDGSYTVDLVNNAPFTVDNGKAKVKITIEWANDEANNTADTKAGKTGGNLTVPITLTAQQHIE